MSGSEVNDIFAFEQQVRNRKKRPQLCFGAARGDNWLSLMYDTYGS